jgi:hypothetical protein
MTELPHLELLGVSIAWFWLRSTFGMMVLLLLSGKHVTLALLGP